MSGSGVEEAVRPQGKSPQDGEELDEEMARIVEEGPLVCSDQRLYVVGVLLLVVAALLNIFGYV